MIYEASTLYVLFEVTFPWLSSSLQGCLPVEVVFPLMSSSFTILCPTTSWTTKDDDKLWLFREWLMYHLDILQTLPSGLIYTKQAKVFVNQI